MRKKEKISILQFATLSQIFSSISLSRIYTCFCYLPPRGTKEDLKQSELDG